jgi:hypothetical protein
LVTTKIRASDVIGVSLTSIGIVAHAAYALSAGLPNRRPMVWFWENTDAFPPEGILFEQVRWYLGRAGELIWLSLAQSDFGATGIPVGEPFVVIIVLLGVAVATLSRTPHAALAWLMLLMTVLVSQARIYPLAGRLGLHLIPVLMLLFALGLEEAADRRPRLRPQIAVAAALVLLVPLSESFHRVLEPVDTEDIRLAIAIVASEFRDGDIVVLNRSSRAQWTAYTESGLIEVDLDVRWITDSGGRAESLDELIGGALGAEGAQEAFRAWFIGANRSDEVEDVVAAAAARWELSTACASHNRGLFLGLLVNDLEDAHGRASLEPSHEVPCSSDALGQ